MDSGIIDNILALVGVLENIVVKLFMLNFVIFMYLISFKSILSSCLHFQLFRSLLKFSL